jgi:hypothetical protein
VRFVHRPPLTSEEEDRQAGTLQEQGPCISSPVSRPKHAVMHCYVHSHLCWTAVLALTGPNLAVVGPCASAASSATGPARSSCRARTACSRPILGCAVFWALEHLGCVSVGSVALLYVSAAAAHFTVLSAHAAHDHLLPTDSLLMLSVSAGSAGGWHRRADCRRGDLEGRVLQAQGLQLRVRESILEITGC